MNVVAFTRPVAAATTLAIALAAAGCADMSERQKGTAVGAGVGAAAGAVIGKTTGGKTGQSAAIGGVVGAIAGNLWSKRMEDKRAAMEKATQGTGIDVARTQDNQLKVNVPSDISFDTGRADLKPEMRRVLDQFAQGLDNTIHVRVIGHTDNTGSDAINDPLSVQRANAVRRYLEDRGVPGSRIETAGRGEHEPVADNNSEAGRARNRRVEIFLREPEQRQG
ncbi:OmpA family protein [Ideonella sp. BN130291]|uniref:OmpA family protein n=1 Tax=Ideonella sp. BN130291 TaxID=3112940 RepID=UPI002E256A53|nr:OmpA family protein [Ideonella sp. BN130291]